MNSNLSLTDDLWQSTLRLFRELKLHLEFTGFPFKLTQPRVIHGQRRFLAGMLTAVDTYPITQGAFVDTEL